MECVDATDVEMDAEMDAIQTDAAAAETAEIVEAVEAGEMEMAVGEIVVGITAAVRLSAMDSARALRKVSGTASRLQMTTVDSRSRAAALAVLADAAAALAQLPEDLVLTAAAVAAGINLRT